MSGALKDGRREVIKVDERIVNKRELWKCMNEDPLSIFLLSNMRFCMNLHRGLVVSQIIFENCD